MEKKLINILDFFIVLLKWKKFLIINFILISIVSIVFSLIVPRWYRSYSVIMSPEGDGDGLSISSLISNALPVGGMLGGAGTSSEAIRFIAIVNSRTMMEDIAKQFNLQERYKTINLERTVKALRNRVFTEVNEDGTITISTLTKTSFFLSQEKDDEARRLAMDMTTYIVKKLDQLNIELNGEKATNSRSFIEKRYLQTLKDLETAEENLKMFQKEYGVISLEEQTLATINTVAELKGQIIAKEIEAKVLENYVGRDHIDFKKAQSVLAALNEQYNALTIDNPNSKVLKSDQVLINIGQMPDLGLQYLRLFREVKLQEAILEFILPQYENAKIQEQKEIPTLQVLDKANYPIKRAKPKRGMLVIFVVFFSMILSVIYIFVFEQINLYKENKSPAYEKVIKLRQLLRF